MLHSARWVCYSPISAVNSQSILSQSDNISSPTISMPVLRKVCNVIGNARHIAPCLLKLTRVTQLYALLCIISQRAVGKQGVLCPPVQYLSCCAKSYSTTAICGAALGIFFKGICTLVNLRYLPCIITQRRSRYRFRQPLHHSGKRVLLSAAIVAAHEK